MDGGREALTMVAERVLQSEPTSANAVVDSFQGSVRTGREKNVIVLTNEEGRVSVSGDPTSEREIQEVFEMLLQALEQRDISSRLGTSALMTTAAWLIAECAPEPMQTARAVSEMFLKTVGANVALRASNVN